MELSSDKDVQIMYCVPRGDFIPRSHVYVRLSQEHNRKSAGQLERNIDAIWSERLAANSKLWNGTKFRIVSTENTSCGVVLNLGITCYKDFIGTNWSPKSEDILAYGSTTYSNSQACMSDALGVGSLVQTDDDKFILLRRSEHCGEAVGLLDIPGGHPEPKELVGKIELSEIDLEDMKADDVVNEIFESTLREIIDEVNIPRGNLSYPVLMGIARNTTSAGRPSSEYFTRCSLTSSEIRQRYLHGGHEEADESTNIVFIPMSDITTLQHNAQIWRELAPSAKGCVVLYQMCIAKKGKS